MQREHNGGPSFNTVSHEEIKSARVADVYFHRTMEVLRQKGKEGTYVHAEVTLKSSDPSKWYVVAGLDEVAHLLEDTETEARAVPEGTICYPHEPILTLSRPYKAFNPPALHWHVGQKLSRYGEDQKRPSCASVPSFLITTATAQLFADSIDG